MARRRKEYVSPDDLVAHARNIGTKEQVSELNRFLTFEAACGKIWTL